LEIKFWEENLFLDFDSYLHLEVLQSLTLRLLFCGSTEKFVTGTLFGSSLNFHLPTNTTTILIGKRSYAHTLGDWDVFSKTLHSANIRLIDR
jgi:hypothetical protein